MIDAFIFFPGLIRCPIIFSQMFSFLAWSIFSDSQCDTTPVLDMDATNTFGISDLWPKDMRRDVQEIFRVTPHNKQVMMFSATLSKEIRVTCKKFMNNVSEASLSFSCSCSRIYSLSKSSSMTNPNSRFTGFSSTSFDWKNLKRIASSTIFSTLWTLTRSSSS
jgi:hypothetical protein